MGLHLSKRKTAAESSCHSRGNALYEPDSSQPAAIETSPPSSLPRRALLPAVAVLVAGLFAWFTWRNYSSFEWVRFAKTFASLNWYWFFLGLFLSAASFVGRAVRWQVMMLPLRSSFWNVTFATYVGFTAIVLFGRAGELIRPYLIARREGTDLAVQAGVWVLERLYDFIVILLLFGVGIQYAIQYARHGAVPAGSRLHLVLATGGWIATGCAVLAAAVFYLMAHRPEFCRQRLSDATAFLSPERHAAFSRALDSFLAGIRPAAHWPTFWKTCALTVAEWAIILGGGYCFFHAVPLASTLGFIDVAAFWGIVSFGSIVQLPGVGGGMQIASIFVLTELFRMPLDQATGFSLLLWACTSLIALPIGVPLAFYSGLNFQKLRRIGRESTL